MKNGILFILILLNHLFSVATTLEVKQDGTGDFTTIQAAVDSAQAYDTVLVWPGTYYENIIIENKGLWLGSLMLTTGNPDYKYSTIIDGGQNSSCIVARTENTNTNVFINGFSIQNGSGYQHPLFPESFRMGGGIFIGEDLNFGIENCIIRNNTCNHGGGGIRIYNGASGFINNCIIYKNRADESTGAIFLSKRTIVSLSGNSIYQNIGITGTGGLFFGLSQSVCIFDSVNRNSIYNNYSPKGCDIRTGPDVPNTTIYLDTATVPEPERYFIYCSDLNGFFNDDSISYNIQNGWLGPVDADLYVDPVNGDDDNSGLSPENALRSIGTAFTRIAIDSLEPNTIHLANGIYSDTISGEKPTIGLRQFVNLEGESMNGTILDGELKYMLLRANNSLSDFKISKMTLRRGWKPYDGMHWSFFKNSLADIYRAGDNITIDSMAFVESWLNNQGRTHVGLWSGNNSRISNSRFQDNHGGYIFIPSGDTIGDTTYISNCIFKSSRLNNELPYPDNICHGFVFGGSSDAIDILTNCLFTDNQIWSFESVFGDLFSSTVHNNYIVNCTFANNSSVENQGEIIIIGGSRNNFYNCVFYDESGVEQTFLLIDAEGIGKSYIGIYNSLVQGGEDVIHVEDDRPYHYDPTNIDADPNFLGMWGDPYMIADGSPCIDAGTLANLPGFISIPDKDLAGNPRIVGDSIDMGAYEWNPTIVGFSDMGPGSKTGGQRLLKASPNPFHKWTYVEATAPAAAQAPAGQLSIVVYDGYGRLVRNILSSNLLQGQGAPWQGDDNTGRPLPPGVYNIVIFAGDKEMGSLKVVKN
ncbi:MAG: hypothetical protein GXO88_08465 [Chlorobi bacterium]|nr:hypothetical protein [Chlorobiota bacterium]